MEVFGAAPHHDILVLLVQIAVLLFTARLLGEAAQRLGQPSVVGEILAGIVLGPSLLSGLIPEVGEYIVPHNETQGHLLEAIGLIGVMLLLLITGLETDLALIRSKARSAIGVSVGGLSLTLLSGFILGELLPEKMVAHPDDRFVFSLFLAIALAISAIPVVAKILMDLHLTRRDVGQTIIASAMIDDTTGWILLSVVISLASGAAITVGGIAESIGRVLGFMAISFTLGYWVVRRLLRFTQANIQSRDKLLSLVIILAFAWGAISQALELEAMLGAFVMGIIFSLMPALDSEVVHRIESITLGIFSPIFFAIAGLKVNIRNLVEPDLLAVLLAVITVATIFKILGIYLGARFIGRSDHWTAIFYGAGLNARGSMGIIIANIGLGLGLLTQDMFSIIVVMAVFTSLIAPFGLRWALRNIQMDEREQERLRREAMNRDNTIANVHRVLLPIRLRENPSPAQQIEARLLDCLGENLSLTLMSVATNDSNGQEFLTRLSQLFTQKDVSRKIVNSSHPTDAILDEMKKGYDLLVLGASERQPNAESLFTPVADTLVRLSPAPTIIVHSPQNPNPDWTPKHILVATTGSVAGKRAAQLGFALASNSGGEVVILKVVQKDKDSGYLTPLEFTERQLNIAHEIVDDLEEMGQLMGVNADGEVEIGANPEATIIEVARKRHVDLIILGTNVRPSSASLYLGPKVEQILRRASCPVVVFNSI